MANKAAPARAGSGARVSIRRAAESDLPAIVALDATTGEPKPDYWRDLFAQFSDAQANKRVFLVAEFAGKVVGFITGEIRAFEFGAERCGWIFAISVDPEMRMHNVGTRLFEAICAIFSGAGVDKVRTLVDRDVDLMLAFFRSQGMIFGHYIQMEMSLG